MIFTIGNVDMTPYTAAVGGIQWQRSDVEGENAGRYLDGTLMRNRIATKVRLDVACKPLTSDEAAMVLTAIQPEWVTVTYEDPQLGEQVTKTMYSNNVPATVQICRADGTTLWGGITFPLIEQ